MLRKGHELVPIKTIPVFDEESKPVIKGEKKELDEFQTNLDYSLLSYSNSANILKFRCLNLFKDEVY